LAWERVSDGAVEGDVGVAGEIDRFLPGKCRLSLEAVRHVPVEVDLQRMVARRAVAVFLKDLRKAGQSTRRAVNVRTTLVRVVDSGFMSSM